MRNGKELPYSKTMFNTSSDFDKYCLSFDKNTNRMNRLIEYKDVQRLVDINGNIITRNVFKKIFIPFRHLNGKDNRVYIESVKGVKNASIYTSKFTSQKISTGYLKKVS
jgi:hypothetical protein